MFSFSSLRLSFDDIPFHQSTSMLNVKATLKDNWKMINWNFFSLLSLLHFIYLCGGKWRKKSSFVFIQV